MKKWIVGEMKWYRVPAQVLLALLLFLFFLSFSVFLTLACKPLYYFDVEFLKIDEESGYDKELIKRNYDALIDYNLPLTDGKLVFPDLKMSDHGEQHFAEVKDIFDMFKVIAIVCVPLCGVGIYCFRNEKNKFYLPLTAGLTVFLPLIAVGLIAANWEQVFVTFHHLFFDNDYWLFDPRYDPVITILPDKFFMHCALMIISLIIAGGAGCLIAFFVGRKNREKYRSVNTEEILKEKEENCDQQGRKTP